MFLSKDFFNLNILVTAEWQKWLQSILLKNAIEQSVQKFLNFVLYDPLWWLF